MTATEKRRAWIIGILITAALLSLIVGPLGIVQLLHLRDLGTETGTDARPTLTPEQLASVVVGEKAPDWSLLDAYNEYPTTDAARYRVFPVSGGYTLEYYCAKDTGISSWTLCHGGTGDELELTHGVSGTALQLFLSSHGKITP